MPHIGTIATLLKLFFAIRRNYFGKLWRFEVIAKLATWTYWLADGKTKKSPDWRPTIRAWNQPFAVAVQGEP
jgi:hypothetical protein